MRIMRTSRRRTSSRPEAWAGAEYQAVVARAAQVRLTGRDEHGRTLDEVFTGWPARIVQHETDHLDGTLYLDRAEPRSLSTHQAAAEYWAQPTPERAARALGFELPRAH